MADTIISRERWDNYISMLRKINEKAASEIEVWMKYNGGDSLLDLTVRDSAGNNIVDAAYFIVQKYGNASSAVAAQLYDLLAEISDVDVPPAEQADLPMYGEIAKTVQGVLKTSQNPEEMAGAVSRLVKRTGMDTTIKNATRDRAEIAFIPHGDTCAYCIALAGSGWGPATSSQYNLNGHPAHLHSNCDCTFGVRFNKTTEYAGYDYRVYRDMYYDAAPPGSSSKDKLNAMRRAFYDKNADKINEQKRSAYLKRMLLNSNAAEEMDVN